MDIQKSDWIVQVPANHTYKQYNTIDRPPHSRPSWTQTVQRHRRTPPCSQQTSTLPVSNSTHSETHRHDCRFTGFSCHSLDTQANLNSGGLHNQFCPGTPDPSTKDLPSLGACRCLSYIAEHNQQCKAEV